MISVPKGTKDVLPQESYKWQYIETTAREVASIFGAKEIRTPTFEHTEVFERGVGDTTDVVNKEMYTFLDKGNRSMTLKPEGTAGVARAFIENGFANSVLPLKLFYITQCFRYERPQAGRLREFHQFGVEFLGADTPETDAEAILLAKTFFDKLGIKNLTLYINSIGCKDCRAKYQAALKAYFEKNVDKLCPLCRERLDKNPMRILDCKNEECKELNKGAPSILDFLCDECNDHFDRVKELLKICHVDYEIDSGIVRGLDYYTRTVFEFVSNNIGAQGTVCGGGRYDGLVSQLGGAKVPGIGFALGIERLLLLMESVDAYVGENKVPEVYFATMGKAACDKAFELAHSLRKLGVICDLDLKGRGIKAQFKYADKIGAKKVVIIGDSELINGTVKLKEMDSGKEEEISFEDLNKRIVK